MRLEAKQYLWRKLWHRRGAGVALTLSTYQPHQATSFHIHANPTVFLLISGDHRDRWLKSELDQAPMTMVFHPTTEPHGTEVGPRGMVGLNVEFEQIWLDQHAVNSDRLE